MLYDEKLIKYTGKDFNFAENLKKSDIQQILQTCLLTTVGDKIKLIEKDSKGDIAKRVDDRKTKRQKDNF